MLSKSLLEEWTSITEQWQLCWKDKHTWTLGLLWSGKAHFIATKQSTKTLRFFASIVLSVITNKNQKITFSLHLMRSPGHLSDDLNGSSEQDSQLQLNWYFRLHDFWLGERQASLCTVGYLSAPPDKMPGVLSTAVTTTTTKMFSRFYQWWLKSLAKAKQQRG